MFLIEARKMIPGGSDGKSEEWIAWWGGRSWEIIRSKGKRYKTRVRAEKVLKDLAGIVRCPCQIIEE